MDAEQMKARTRAFALRDSIGREFAKDANWQRHKKSDASLWTVCWRKLSSCLPS